MTFKPIKPKISEYNRPYNRHSCSSPLRLTATEIRYVDETPGIQWWWEDVILPADHEPGKLPICAPG